MRTGWLERGQEGHRPPGPPPMALGWAEGRRRGTEPVRPQPLPGAQTPSPAAPWEGPPLTSRTRCLRMLAQLPHNTEGSQAPHPRVGLAEPAQALGPGLGFGATFASFVFWQTGK